MTQKCFQSAIFDLDGVITDTAKIHFKAWKQTFEEYLRLAEKKGPVKYRPFTHDDDYLPYVDGKPRYKGVDSFLKSRGINLPWGSPSDGPEKETVCGIGNKKNLEFRKHLTSRDIEVFPAAIDFVKRLKARGIKVGVASSSKNCAAILNCARIRELFETVVDGEVSARLKLKGKPEGDIFVKAAENMKADPKYSMVVEDATSGIAAGRNAGFGLVLGIAMKKNRQDLLEEGADIVVEDFDNLKDFPLENFFLKTPNHIFDFWDKNPSSIKTEAGELLFKKEKIFFSQMFYRKASEFLSTDKTVFFLDYDGTLTPIVSRPELAIMSEEMRKMVKELNKKFRVAIVSGRGRQDVEKLVDIPDLIYAGNHGFDIRINSENIILQEMEKYIPLVARITNQFNSKLSRIEGVIIEKKKFSVAVHYRLARDTEFPFIEREVAEVIKNNPDLRLMKGKKVFEILPRMEWDKGKALMRIMKTLGLDWKKQNIIYIGDDTTDEDAFRVVRGRGMGVLVSKTPKRSFADFYVNSVNDVKKIFEYALKV